MTKRPGRDDDVGDLAGFASGSEQFWLPGRGPQAIPERWRQRAAIFYATCAGVLVPWIVYLSYTQQRTAVAHHVVALTGGIFAVGVVALLVAAWLCYLKSAHAVLALTFAGGVAFVAAWFYFITNTVRAGPRTPVMVAILSTAIVVLSWTVADRLADARGSFTCVARWVWAAYALAAAAVLGMGIHVLAVVPDLKRSHHLRLAWTGLDVFELAALASTAWTLHRRSPRVSVAATTTAALLVGDAWFNIAADTGPAQLAAIAMAFVEIPLAALSLFIALFETRSWATHRGRKTKNVD